MYPQIDVKDLEKELMVSQRYQEEPEFESMLSSTRNESTQFLNVTPVLVSFP
jgi:hypothetical protein